MELIAKGLGGNRFQGGVTDIKGSELVPGRDRRGKGERERETGGYFFCGELRGEKVFFFPSRCGKVGTIFRFRCEEPQARSLKFRTVDLLTHPLTHSHTPSFLRLQRGRDISSRNRKGKRRINHQYCEFIRFFPFNNLFCSSIRCLFVSFFSFFLFSPFSAWVTWGFGAVGENSKGERKKRKKGKGLNIIAHRAKHRLATIHDRQTHHFSLPLPTAPVLVLPFPSWA